jgi:hypothetical protein
MGKTIQVAADRAFDQTKTVLPAEVARGTYMRNAPSLSALKVMHLMIGKAGGRMAEDVRHELRLSDLREIEGMKNHDRASLAPLFAELAAAVLVNDDPEAMVMTIGGLLDEARIDYRHEVSGDLLVTWYFGRTFRRMAEKSCHWAIIDRQTVFHLGSKYSVLLFQHIASLVKLDHLSSKTFSVEDLRAVLGVEKGKLARFSHLNDRALKPAIAEINQLSRLILTATANKVGRTVGSVTIGWEEKPQEAKQEAKRELDRPKVGRSARRAGTVETVAAPPPAVAAPKAPAFPASGSIRYAPGPWLALAEAHTARMAGGVMPDLGGLADAFRQWSAAKGLPLKGADVAKRWIAFCKGYKPLFGGRE